MRQRLGIAQAIAGNPRLIIVDEPTAGLDPEERLRFYRLLSELAEDRIVLLVHPHRRGRGRPLLPVRRDPARPSDRLHDARTRPAKAIEGTIYEGTISAEFYHQLLASIRPASRRRTWSRAATAYGSTSRKALRPTGFAPVAATLEDAYLVLIKTGRLYGLEPDPLAVSAALKPATNGAGLLGRRPGRWLMSRAITASLRRFRTVFWAISPIIPAGRCFSSGP